ncbi:hypothetical protein SAMN04489712_10948 [Thermomonospora echinospora]|uniref:Uncharacterized protein n=1 Tax=Thermomonospora echinospora TaxID=1992 RepID=A0A1H6C869_9ACTN|nr:hypothetical protein [Thermomonospora echinospora]SEG69093.1 hypothetical protein SAMN04489712_10948 [Thermomonospora echinospora]
MIYHLAADLTFDCADPDGGTDEDFDQFTDAIADELLDLAEVDPGIVDPDVTVRIADRWVSVLMGIEADSEDDAFRLFAANLRAALHAAGCGTAEWPTFKPRTRDPKVRRTQFAGA